jgi:predicted RND superfamily exporter protein
METLARFIGNRTHAWGIVLTTVLLAAAGVLLAGGVEHEDDLLAFLPQDNPDVKLFQDINKRFGGLDLALVGIQTDDAFDPHFLTKLRQVTKDLKETQGLDHVLSLANIIDFTPDQERGGVITALLVEKIPRTEAERQALRKRALSRDHLVGNLISRDGKAVLIYCYLAYGSDQMTMAARIKDVVRRTLPQWNDTGKIFWGGGPFVSTYIYNTSQHDIRRLTPWAVLAVVLIMILSFRDIIGSCLVLLSTGMGIVISMGTMAVLGVKFNIVLGSMPVILFAIGSAYGIHVLARYYTLSQTHDVQEAIQRTLTGIGPTVMAAGLTTAASLLSFVLMDIRPLRTFGLFTSLGIVVTLLLSLTFVPAVARLAGLRRKQTSSLLLRRQVMRLTVFAQRRRLATGVLLGLVAAAGLAFTARVDNRMDNASFFSAGSPPDRAEEFLRQHFGGSLFVQLYARGDMTDPDMLREIQGLADEIELLPHVSSVVHVGQAVARVNEIMVGQDRIPDTQAQVKLLYTFLTGDPSVAQLVNVDRDQALMHVKLDTSRAAETEPLIQRLEQLVAGRTIHAYVKGPASSGPGQARVRKLLLDRISALAHLYGADLPAGKLRRMDRLLQGPAPPADASAVEAGLLRFLHSEECAVELPAAPAPGTQGEGPAAGDPAQAIAAAVVRLGPKPAPEALNGAVAAALGKPADDVEVEDLVLSLSTPLEELWRMQRAKRLGNDLVAKAGLELPEGGPGQRFRRGLATALLDLDLPTTLLPHQGKAGAAGTLEMQVNGLPVMHRGLSRSVTRNQILSLSLALVLVVLIMTVLFRSLWSGLLVSMPTLLTLAVIYGGMGLMGVHLDIGTSMLACLILGAGVDYAVHLASAWHAPEGGTLRDAAAVAADRAGPAIWTNAIMVCAGFFVLTLGEARPLQNVGGLTAAAMITAALATFLALPVLARRLQYRRNSEAHGLEELSEAAQVVVKESKI